MICSPEVRTLSVKEYSTNLPVDFCVTWISLVSGEMWYVQNMTACFPVSPKQNTPPTPTQSAAAMHHPQYGTTAYAPAKWCSLCVSATMGPNTNTLWFPRPCTIVCTVLLLQFNLQGKNNLTSILANSILNTALWISDHVSMFWSWHGIACPFKTYVVNSPPLPLTCMQHHTWHTSAYKFQQADILPLPAMKSVPSAPVSTKSPPGMPPLSCTVILSMLATHPVNYTFLYECLLLCLPSQTHSCANHTVTTVSQMSFNCTSII